jgi:aspartyl-tRNA(Asn)/glutamyl-tRNA(Gln) amidotransferase subunit C
MYLMANRRLAVKLTREDIAHIATLSRLSFDDKELDKFTKQMGEIIDMANQLQAVDTKGVPATTQVVDRDTVFREDQPEKWQSRSEMLQNVPDSSNGFIKVPVIIDKDDND